MALSIWSFALFISTLLQHSCPIDITSVWKIQDGVCILSAKRSEAPFHLGRRRTAADVETCVARCKADAPSRCRSINFNGTDCFLLNYDSREAAPTIYDDSRCRLGNFQFAEPPDLRGRDCVRYGWLGPDTYEPRRQNFDECLDLCIQNNSCIGFTMKYGITCFLDFATMPIIKVGVGIYVPKKCLINTRKTTRNTLTQSVDSKTTALVVATSTSLQSVPSMKTSPGTESGSTPTMNSNSVKSAGISSAKKPLIKWTEAEYQQLLMLLETDRELSASLNDDLSRLATIESRFSFLLAEMFGIDYSLIMDVGVQLVDTILHCSINGENCDHERDFISRYIPQYGNCFTFNYSDPLDRFQTGQQEMNLILDAGVQEFICTSLQAGFLIVMHDAREEPFPNFDGFKTNAQRMEPPYGNCEARVTNQDYFYNSDYSLEGCYNSCLQRIIVNHCECYDPRYPKPPAVNRSCTLAERNCTDFVTDCATNGGNLREICSCKQSCRDVYYETTMSSTFLTSNKALKTACLKRNNYSECMRRYRKHFAVLNILFDGTKYVLHAETPVYELVNWLADFGSILGIFLGVSVITLTETLITLIVIMFHCVLPTPISIFSNN